MPLSRRGDQLVAGLACGAEFLDRHLEITVTGKHTTVRSGWAAFAITPWEAGHRAVVAPAIEPGTRNGSPCCSRPRNCGTVGEITSAGALVCSHHAASPMSSGPGCGRIREPSTNAARRAEHHVQRFAGRTLISQGADRHRRVPHPDVGRVDPAELGAFRVDVDDALCRFVEIDQGPSGGGHSPKRIPSRR